MDIVAPIPPNIYNVHSVVPTQATKGAVQHNLLPHQLIQATVVETGDRQVLLDMGQQQLRAQTDVEMQNGQKLNLEVVATHPRLTLQMVAPSADNQLLRLLHMYDHRSEIGTALAKLLGHRSAASAPAAQQTSASANTASTAAAGSTMSSATSVGGEASATSTAPSSSPATSPSSSPVSSHPSAGRIVSSTGQSVDGANTVGRSGAEPVPSGQKQGPAAVIVTEKHMVAPESAVSSPKGAPALTTSGQYKGLPIEHPTQLLPLTAQQRHQVEAALTPQQWSQLEQLSQTLVSNFQDSGTRLLLGLARNLGLDFEVLLAQDQAQQASQTLKGALIALNEQADLPEAVRESSQQLVQQLELLQLTRARLAQEGILFLPLPFEFMEQGYVLVEQGGGGKEGEAQSHLVTLNMSLQQLGPLQANLLFEQQGLYVRILCDGDSCLNQLQDAKEELHHVLTPFGVRSIQFSQGAEDPAVALLKRLEPKQGGVLDERV